LLRAHDEERLAENRLAYYEHFSQPRQQMKNQGVEAEGDQDGKGSQRGHEQVTGSPGAAGSSKAPL